MCPPRHRYIAGSSRVLVDPGPVDLGMSLSEHRKRLASHYLHNRGLYVDELHMGRCREGLKVSLEIDAVSKELPQEREKVIQMLLEHGADPNAQGNQDETPLASRMGKQEIVSLLLNYSANVNARSEQGSTPLHEASATGQLEIVKLLLDHNADDKARTSDGWTPLHYASRHGWLGVVQLLVDSSSATTHEQPPSPRVPSLLNPVARWTQGTVVPQRRWTPAEGVDIRRYVEEATFQLPIFFTSRNCGVGFWLPDILQGHDRDLMNRDSEASLGGVQTTHLLINVSSHFFYQNSHPCSPIPLSGRVMTPGCARYPLEMIYMGVIRSRVANS
jgi:hypothetical protein